MRSRMLVAFLAGAAFFAALPLLAPPVVLQWEGVPYLLAGLAGATAAGAVLRLVAGDRQAWALVLACVIAGAIVSTLGFLILGYVGWGAEAVIVALMLPVLTFAYLIVPAAVGAWLAGAARERFERSRRG
jgi:uncharacterized membrane protein